MSKDKDKKSNNNKGLKDAHLWRSMTRDVKPLPGKTYDDVSDPDEEEETADTPRRSLPPKQVQKPPKAPQGREMDRRTEDRLRKGKLQIEARLDLHGMKQDEAHEALDRFIKRVHAQGKRCVLVITGRGKSQAGSEDWLAPKPGVLKRRVPEWLEHPSLKHLILRTATARQKDGGEGALYVYLRRMR